ncbi:MAG: CaiB/BaiF CoA-transferase family protein, partial [Actinomycetota bacterium]
NHVGIEIEPPGPLFDLDNRGKRSALLDLRDDADRATCDALVARSDVLVTNVRPGALERLGLAPDALVERYPRLIVGSITGFGWSGPDRDRPGHATGAFWARSGLAASVVPDGQMPPPLPPGTGGHEAALGLVAGILAKLHERQITNRGGVVDVSLLRSGVYALGSDLAARQRYGHEPSTAPRDECETPLVNVYRASGGERFWLLCLEGDRHWQGLADSIERSDVVADRRFADAAGRFQHRRELIAVLDAAFAEHPLAVWADRFDRNDVWWEPVVDPNDVIDDPQAQTCFVDGSVSTPVDFDGVVPRPGPVPAAGEHTAEIRAELD